MATRLYGESDDLVEMDGDVRGEVGAFGTDDREQGVLIICDDGTLLEIKYGKAGMGIWGITLIKPGTLFDRIEYCTDENAKIDSDIVYFKDGLKWAYAAREWQRVN